MLHHAGDVGEFGLGVGDGVVVGIDEFEDGLGTCDGISGAAIADLIDGA